ncbi:sodium/substrate symporter small subunit [Tibeticola sp.]|uniref:DUF4212 domain-containing protein n=1 Tax=Tibeticola sp. TaxID=2005368 RepID=UPI00258A9BE2|nr:sodium/substrate symporter small subunit [Tibeticola sp.]MCI4439815.1 DUF4212 domain-containing protein [Tibeticola sp.]
MTQPNPLPSASEQSAWSQTRRLTFILLLVWWLATIALVWGAPGLQFRFFGWPFGFWAAAQGLPLLYLFIVVIYARRVRRIERDVVHPA